MGMGYKAECQGQSFPDTEEREREREIERKRGEERKSAPALKTKKANEGSIGSTR